MKRKSGSAWLKSPSPRCGFLRTFEVLPQCFVWGSQGWRSCKVRSPGSVDSRFRGEDLESSSKLEALE